MSRGAKLRLLISMGPLWLLLLFATLAKADVQNGITMTVYDNMTEWNEYNSSPPVPPSTPIVGVTTVSSIDRSFDADPAFGLWDDFVVKFEGSVTSPWSGTVYFMALADDGTILYLNDQMVSYDWWDKGGGGSQSIGVDMVAGTPQSFTLWYYENGGGAWVQLWWLIDGNWDVVPPSAFTQVPEETTTTWLETTTTVMDVQTTAAPTTVPNTNPPTSTSSSTSSIPITTVPKTTLPQETSTSFTSTSIEQTTTTTSTIQQYGTTSTVTTAPFVTDPKKTIVTKRKVKFGGVTLNIQVTKAQQTTVIAAVVVTTILNGAISSTLTQRSRE